MEQVKGKCEHGVHLSPGDALAWGCQLCYPAGHPETTQEPVLPQSSGDSLGRGDAREMCSKCGNLRTYFAPNCRHCDQPFPDDASRGCGQITANRRQVGACPECGSTVHYETKKKSMWQCSDCNLEFRAPKPAEVSDEVE